MAILKKTIDDAAVAGQRVIVRVDFNVPLDKKTGVITDDKRIKAALPTIEHLVREGARVILVSHLGRPKGFDPAFSLKPAAERLSELLAKPVVLAADVIGDDAKAKVEAMRDGDVVMLENVRFHSEETKNDRAFAQALASFGDLYVNDAFGTAHRAHASTAGLANFLPAVSGYLIEKEIEVMAGALARPEKPFVAILGGAKVSDKIGVIENLLNKVDTLIIGGGMAYTFFAARGWPVGKSISEPDKIDLAKSLMEQAAEKGVNLLLPVDTVVTRDFAADAEYRTVPSDSIGDDEMGMDIGEKSIEIFVKAIDGAKMIVWNGPMGVFEFDNFANGTRRLAEAVAGSGGVSIIGGGDSAAAVERLGFADKVSHISTGGGASLELLEGRVLPGLDVLDDKDPRRLFVAGNWKMNNGLPAEAGTLISDLHGRLADADAKVVVAPPFTALPAALERTAYTNIAVAAQDGHFEDKGAYTGEVALSMIADLGIRYVILGHSERRAMFGDTDTVVEKKVNKALSLGLRPILCVGESLAEREAGQTTDVVGRQLAAALANVDAKKMHFVVIAYEPIWAIGTGKVATEAEAEEVCAFIRTYLTERYGEKTAAETKILYGGSVNAGNAKGLFATANIDGALVGGASLKAADFAAIAKGGQ